MNLFDNPAITIRRGYADDDIGLRRLAALDSAAGVPPAPLLVAEIDGQLGAALSLRTGEVIADPFVRTAEAAELLRLHAQTVARRGRPLARTRRSRLVPRPARA